MNQSSRPLSITFSTMPPPRHLRSVLHTNPPMQIEGYIDKGEEDGYWDAYHFGAMRTKGGCNHLMNGIFKVLTTLSGWNKRWNHWGGLGPLRNVLEGPVEMPYISILGRGIVLRAVLKL